MPFIIRVFILWFSFKKGLNADDPEDLPVSMDDSIVHEFDKHCNDSTLDFQFAIPDLYYLPEIPKIDSSKANTKTVTHYENGVVDVLSYGNNLTRLFPDGCRIYWAGSGDISVFLPKGDKLSWVVKGNRTEVETKDSKFTILKSGIAEKVFETGKIIKWPNGKTKLIRNIKDELTRTEQGEIQKMSRFGKISFLRKLTDISP